MKLLGKFFLWKQLSVDISFDIKKKKLLKKLTVLFQPQVMNDTTYKSCDIGTTLSEF